jgi:hypothetical protein
MAPDPPSDWGWAGQAEKGISSLALMSHPGANDGTAWPKYYIIRVLKSEREEADMLPGNAQVEYASFFRRGTYSTASRGLGPRPFPFTDSFEVFPDLSRGNDNIVSFLAFQQP